MRIATIVSLGVSGLLGLGALVTAKVFLPAGSAKDAAADSQATTPVVVAAKALDYGTAIARQDLTVVRLPKSAAPEGAYSTIDQIFGAGGAPLALAPLAAREPILPARLSTGGARPSVAATIAPGMRAYTVRITEVSGVGGHALPGDHVDVVLMRDTSDDARKPRLVSEIVLQDVRVLAVDLNADLASTKVQLPKTATLEVAVADVQKLSMAGDIGTLSLALRRTGASEKDPVQTLASAAFTVAAIGAAAPRNATPPVVRVARPSSAPRPAAPAGRQLLIVNGSDRVALSVPAERGL